MRLPTEGVPNRVIVKRTCAVAFVCENIIVLAIMNNKSSVPDRIRPLAARRGRPRKFTAPSRAVTLTLPEPVLAALSAVNQDLSRAVVRITQPELAKHEHPPAELATFGGRAVIVVNPSRTLERRTGILSCRCRMDARSSHSMNR